MRSAELQSKDAACALLESQLVTMREELHSITAQLTDAQEAVKKTLAEHSGCAKDKGELEAELATQIERHLKAVEEHQTSENALKARLKSARHEVERNTEQLADQARIYEKREAEHLADIERYERDLREATSKKQAEVNEAEQEESKTITALRIETDRLTRTLAKERKIHVLQLEDLQEQLKEAREESNRTLKRPFATEENSLSPPRNKCIVIDENVPPKIQAQAPSDCKTQ